MIVGLREQLAELTTRMDSPALEKQLAHRTHSVVMLAEHGARMKEKLHVAERIAGGRAEGRGEVQGIGGEGGTGEGREGGVG